MLPRRITRESKPGVAKRIRSPGHLAWVRTHECCAPNCDGRPIEAAHVRTGTNGGTGIKPDDTWTISLCRHHHRIQHLIGERVFEEQFGIDMKALAREFAVKSPYRKKWERR